MTVDVLIKAANESWPLHFGRKRGPMVERLRDWAAAHDAFDNSQDEEVRGCSWLAMLAIPTAQRRDRASIRRSWIHGTLDGNWRMS